MTEHVNELDNVTENVYKYNVTEQVYEYNVTGHVNEQNNVIEYAYE